MARLNISVPESLKERMDSEPFVNWSGVAQRAFTAYLRILDETDKEFRASINKDCLDQIKRQLMTDLLSALN